MYVDVKVYICIGWFMFALYQVLMGYLKQQFDSFLNV